MRFAPIVFVLLGLAACGNVQPGPAGQPSAVNPETGSRPGGGGSSK